MCVCMRVYVCIKHQAQLVYFNDGHAKHSALSKHFVILSSKHIILLTRNSKVN